MLPSVADDSKFLSPPSLCCYIGMHGDESHLVQSNPGGITLFWVSSEFFSNASRSVWTNDGYGDISPKNRRAACFVGNAFLEIDRDGEPNPIRCQVSCTFIPVKDSK